MQMSTPQTALQPVVSLGDGVEMVRYLIAPGAGLSALGARICGPVVLQFAAAEGLLGIAELLLKEWADINTLSSILEGRTALESAAEHVIWICFGFSRAREPFWLLVR